MRKRNILLAIGALEVMTLPAAANIFDGFKLPDRSNVIAAEIPMNIPGEKQYFVSSNSAFAIIGQNMNGMVNVEIQDTGQLGHVRYGDVAQLPGSPGSCTESNIRNPRIIYQANRATFVDKADAIDQSVLVKISYSETSQPKFQFVTPKQFEIFEPAKACKTDAN